MDELVELLRSTAYSGLTDLDWDLSANSETIRVEAATQEQFSSADQAYRAAEVLRASILALGWSEQYRAEVRAVGDQHDTSDPMMWRGAVNLGLRRNH